MEFQRREQRKRKKITEEILLKIFQGGDITKMVE